MEIKNQKKMTGLVARFTALAIMASLCSITPLVAGQSMPPDHNPPMGRGFGPPSRHLLSKAIHDNMAADALVEITGKDLTAVKAELANTHLMQVLTNNSIDPETFRKLMDAKMATATQKAAGCGLITTEQASEILAQLK